MKRSLAFHAYAIFVWGIFWAFLMLMGVVPESLSEMFQWKIITSFVVAVILNFMVVKYLEGLLNFSEDSRPYFHVIVDYVGFFAFFVLLLKAFGV